LRKKVLDNNYDIESADSDSEEEEFVD